MSERFRPTREQIMTARIDPDTSGDWDRHVLEYADPEDRRAVEKELRDKFVFRVDPDLMRRLINDIRMK